MFLNNPLSYEETSFSPTDVWYVSDQGSDDNDCHTESAPCWNLQTVLDRATDGADIYVVSDTLSVDAVYGVDRRGDLCCEVTSSKSYRLSSLHDKTFSLTCLGELQHCFQPPVS